MRYVQTLSKIPSGVVDFVTHGFAKAFVRRRLFHKANLDSVPEYGNDGMPIEKIAEVKSVEDANLISSKITNLAGWHAPVLDLDFPCVLVKSSTPGHYHLYLNKIMSWERYVKLLKALKDAGLIEEGYYQASIARGATFVRPPGVHKKPLSQNL